MVHKRQGVLAQIEAGVLDDTVSVSSLLQKCIVLGGQAGSEKMRDWAREELNGYEATAVPRYRRLSAGLVAVITNRAGYNPMTQRISASVLPRQVRDFLRDEGTDLDLAILGGSIGQLEALASKGDVEHKIIPPWGDVIQDLLNKYCVTENSRVQVVYWPVSDASLRGLLVQVRTALAELVAELSALTPQGQEVPDKLVADQAVHFVVTGDRNTITVSSQHASGGTNVTVGAAGPRAGRPDLRGGLAGAGAAYGAVVGQQAGGCRGRRSVCSTVCAPSDEGLDDGQAARAWRIRRRSVGSVRVITPV